MLSVHEDVEYMLESVRAGAHGYLRKDSTPAELRAGHPGAARRADLLLAGAGGADGRGAARGAGATASAPARATDVLTARERQILVHIAQGKTNKEIGAELGISTRTVEAHRDSLMRKLGHPDGGRPHAAGAGAGAARLSASGFTP